MEKVIVLASHNKGKVKEFQKILGEFGYIVKSVSEFGYDEEPEENGETYSENSYIKAKFYYDLLKMPVIADDSGIEIAALGNHFPGIYSARYRDQVKNEYGDGPENVNKHILEKMENVTDRSASFHCSICLIEEGGTPIYFEGICPGKILNDIAGDHGFGYDPIFFAYENEVAFGTASEDEKNKVSHRGKAIEKVIAYFKNKDAQLN